MWCEMDILPKKSVILTLTSKKKKNKNNKNNKSTLKYTRSEDYSDNANNYDKNFDFEETGTLIYQRKREKKIIINK